MVRRKDVNLEVTGGVSMARASHASSEWRGLNLAPGARFLIPDARRFSSLRHFPAHCGWMLDAPPGLTLRVSVLGSEDRGVLAERTYQGNFQCLFLPWPRQPCGKVDIVVSCEGAGKAPAFVANQRVLSRQWLYDLCVGKGIEIGPGPVPQILPREGTEIFYLEQMPAEEWNRLYNGGGKYPTKPELWGNYIVGEASAPPVEDGSLDFIFGSHVFEHLVNPIGHLERWKGKLASGGKVIMVVPDLNGTKDSVHYPCSIESLIDEFRRGIWLPETSHYVRHLRRREGDKHLIAAMERMESIHAHYYDNVNCQVLLDFAVRELGFADYVIEHTPNHKDFYFVLINK